MPKKINLAGERFGKLLVISESSKTYYKNGYGRITWNCICDCGRQKNILSGSLMGGLTNSCGCLVKESLIGKQFGRLVVISEANNTSDNKSMWNCICICGESIIVRGVSLKDGDTKSCGCLARETRIALNYLQKGGKSPRYIHGEAKGKPTEYNTWVNIKRRCNNKNGKDYPYYGGRGIKICLRWQNDYALFLADIGRKPSREYTVERIDNNGDYEPSNCKWATRKEQANNRRPMERRKE